MIDRSRVTGLVLSGGRGTRMGSVDKGLEVFDGRPLVVHALARLAPQVGALLISANRHRERYEALGRDHAATVVEDRFPDHPGPLAGLHAGLAACTTDYLVAVPCDAPFFPPELVHRLADAFEDVHNDDANIDVAIAGTASGTHPVFCLMRRGLAPALARHIEAGGRRVHGWLTTMRVRTVSFADEATFRNLNTIEELRAAEAGRRTADTATGPRVKATLPPALRLDEARARIAAVVATVVEQVTGTERVVLSDALDRVLATNLFSMIDVPGHANAAMDGYALPAGRMARTSFAIVGVARAGHPYAGSVAADQCVRIMTGAVLPGNCDAVVPQEQVTVADGRITIDDGVDIAPGQHRRPAGEDLHAGAVAMLRGRRIAPADLGIAASIGCIRLEVLRRLRVAVFSTGAELREPDDPLPHGCIRDANRYTLIAMLRRLDVDVIDLGIVDDDAEALEATLRNACSDDVRADAIVTSGGVSVGDADHTRTVMARLGSVDFWTLAVKPGRPMAFGRVASDGREALLFGLPGNPVAVMVVFYALVRDALIALSGASPEALPSLTAVCDEPLSKTPGRTEFVRAVARREPEGWHVRTTGTQSSGVLRSMSDANCLIVLDHDRGPVAAGDPVEAWPLRGLL